MPCMLCGHTGVVLHPPLLAVFRHLVVPVVWFFFAHTPSPGLLLAWFSGTGCAACLASVQPSQGLSACYVCMGLFVVGWAGGGGGVGGWVLQGAGRRGWWQVFSGWSENQRAAFRRTGSGQLHTWERSNGSLKCEFEAAVQPCVTKVCILCAWLWFLSLLQLFTQASVAPLPG